MTEPTYEDQGLGDEWEAPPGTSWAWPYEGSRTVWVRSARFGASAFDDNNTQLTLDCLVDDPNIPEKEFEYKVGKRSPGGYESIDGENLNSDKGDFGTRNNFYAKFVHEVTRNREFADFVAHLKANQGSPKRASTWVGHAFEMEAHEFKFGAGIDATVRAWPVRWIGHFDSVPFEVQSQPGLPGTAPAAPTPATTPDVTTSTPVATPASPAAENGATEDQLRAAAIAAGSYENFMTSAAKLKPAAPILVRILQDDTYYNELLASAQ